MWIARPALALAFAFSLAACGSKSKPPQTPPDPPADTVDVALLGSACGDAGACPTGMTCAKYYGIAGPSGPEFSSCEVACTGDGAACPTGSSCTTIADGPGAVCRPPAAEGEEPPVQEAE